jgi:hypothetical protein
MFFLQIAQVLEIELIVPVSQVRLMVIGPTVDAALGECFAVGAERLIAMNTHGMAESAVIKLRIGLLAADITNRFLDTFF